MVEKTLKEQRIGVENVQGTESSQMKLSVVEKFPRGPKVTVLLLYRRQMINPLVWVWEKHLKDCTVPLGMQGWSAHQAWKHCQSSEWSALNTGHRVGRTEGTKEWELISEVSIWEMMPAAKLSVLPRDDKKEEVSCGCWRFLEMCDKLTRLVWCTEVYSLVLNRPVVCTQNWTAPYLSKR